MVLSTLKAWKRRNTLPPKNMSQLAGERPKKGVLCLATALRQMFGNIFQPKILPPPRARARLNRLLGGVAPVDARR